MSKILIVDDSLAMRKLIGRSLETFGHEVVAASDGDEAIDLAKAGAFELVITDYNMPGMNGIELIIQLRTMEICRLIPILVLSTEGNADFKAQSKVAGATGWLTKPFNPEQLAKVIDRVLS